MAAQSWTPIREAIDDLWDGFLLPPGGNLNSFCAVLMANEDRFPSDFLSTFMEMFNALRCASIDLDLLSDPLKAIVKKAGKNVWNSKEDSEYEIPKSMMIKLFHHVRDKIKKREREQRKKEMNQKIQETHQSLKSLQRAIQDLWIIFLTPPQGKIRSLISVLMKEDQRFMPGFLSDFLEIFDHLCGFSASNQVLLNIFQDIEWDPKVDPEYELPQKLMEDLYNEYEDELLGNDQEISIEANRMNKKILMEDALEIYVKGKKESTREGKLGRMVTKTRSINEKLYQSLQEYC